MCIYICICEAFLEINIDSHALTKKITREMLYIPDAVSNGSTSYITSCIIIVDYHNQVMDIDTVHRPYSEFTFLHALTFVH